MQLPSGKSIVVLHDTSVYKLIVGGFRGKKHLREVVKLRAILKSSKCPDVFSIPFEKELHNGIFLQYPRLIFPLKKTEALLCLREFITKTATTIHHLHSCGYVHCDIRLENIIMLQGNW